VGGFRGRGWLAGGHVAMMPSWNALTGLQPLPNALPSTADARRTCSRPWRPNVSTRATAIRDPVELANESILD
jgi:hypothetical protein